ncbi:MAG: hypothetical protein LBP85_01190, partial [Prevotellaceae bacterium]|nr:hypothetical protein [Prevotellaceae bacterium]
FSVFFDLFLPLFSAQRYKSCIIFQMLLTLFYYISIECGVGKERLNNRYYITKSKYTFII